MLKQREPKRETAMTIATQKKALKSLRTKGLPKVVIQGGFSNERYGALCFLGDDGKATIQVFVRHSQRLVVTTMYYCGIDFGNTFTIKYNVLRNLRHGWPIGLANARNEWKRHVGAHAIPLKITITKK